MAPENAATISLIGRVLGGRSKWVTIVLWFVIAALTIVWLGKLQDVTAQDVAAFLPKSSESAKLVEEQKKLPGASALEVTISYRRDQGQLTASDEARITNDREKLVAHYRIPNTDPVAFSHNQQGALIKISVPGIDTDEQKQAEVKVIRNLIASSNDGLSVLVTGPAAFVADAEDIYSSINVTLISLTMLIVAVVLLVTYRSPLLLFLPLITVLISDGLASWLVGMLAKSDIITLDGQSAGILPVLVFGVGTDYSLLLIARYREELRSHEDIHVAMRNAVLRAGPTIFASGLTVVLAFLALLATELNSNRALGVVGFFSIGLTVIATVTLLPALLLAFGRRVFWPVVPRFGDAPPPGRGWVRTGELVGRKAPAITLITVAVMAIAGLSGTSQIDTNLKQIDFFRSQPDSVAGQKQLEKDFAGGSATPLMIVANTRELDGVRSAVASVPGVRSAVRIDQSNTATPDCIDDQNKPGTCLDRNGRFAMIVVLTDRPDTAAERQTVRDLRTAVHAVPGADAVAGSGGAERLDLAVASGHDSRIVVPLVLLVAFVVFCLLLRAIVASLVLVLSVLLSYGAALGVTVLVSHYLFRLPAIEQSVPFLGFVFLVALGIDYCVFLAIRIRENVNNSMPTATATVEALRATGTVITSAGAVLAATFAILAVLPIVSVTELGFLVAFGVLLDTFIVRSLLVPAVFVWLGDKTWWPARRS